MKVCSSASSKRSVPTHKQLGTITLGETPKSYSTSTKSISLKSRPKSNKVKYYKSHSHQVKSDHHHSQLPHNSLASSGSQHDLVPPPPHASSSAHYQTHSRHSSLESDIILHKITGGRTTPTGTEHSTLSGSHQVIFHAKPYDQEKHSRNCLIFSGLLCLIITLCLVFLMLLRNSK
jgi:hypothetical protein